MIEERESFIKTLIKNDYNYEGLKEAIGKIEQSDIKSHGKSIPFSYIPLFVNDNDFYFFDSIIKKISGIISKVTNQFIIDEQYRKIFNLQKEMEDLIMLPCNYNITVPVGRYDLFYNENNHDFMFCEFNTDGSGGMSRDEEISKAILENKRISNWIDKYNVKPFQTIDSIAKTLYEIYKTTPNAVLNPTIVVCDFKEEGVFSDFNRFIEAFRRLGVSSRFTDVRDLVFDGNYLRDKNDGKIIHAIYRRAVTSVVLNRMNECSNLINAVKHNRVVLLGSFKTSLAHSKSMFAGLCNKKTYEFLSEDEIDFVKKHIPKTYFLTQDLLNGGIGKQALTNKDMWIIKPQEGFASHGVYAGENENQNDWNNLLYSLCDTGYILQEFCPRYKIPILSSVDTKMYNWSLMLGIYQAGEMACGFYSRCGENKIIDFNHGGICLSSVRVESI